MSDVKSKVFKFSIVPTFPLPHDSLPVVSMVCMLTLEL